MVDLGVSEVDRQAVFSATAAVMHLGNITFDVIDTPAGPGSTVSSSPSSYSALTKAAELLNVSADRLAEDLCTLTIRNSRDTIRKTLTVQAALCTISAQHGCLAISPGVALYRCWERARMCLCLYVSPCVLR